MRLKVWISLFLILILTALTVIVDLPSGPDLKINWGKLKIDKKIKVRLGLDLQGGTHLVYEADLSKIDPKEYDNAMAGVRDVIERRVNALGVSEPLVQTNRTEGHYRVIIELAGVTDVNEAINMIGQTPSLDFREQTEPPKEGEQSSADLTKGLKVEGEGENAKLVDEKGQPVDMTKLSEELKKQQEGVYGGFKMTDLTGNQLKKAELQFDPQSNQPIIGLEFNNEGKKLFGEITERSIGKPLAIFLDGAMISAPKVNEKISDGKAVISGSFTIDEAKQLAQRLNAGALPVPVKLLSQTTIGAALSQDSIQRSVFTGLLGIILVALFMIIYYRLPGLLSVFALLIYALLALALFKLIPITLTLAGIAGFILSLGMAVDANVLIFERLKEELRAGRSLGFAVDEGFKHAWNSIRDSNVSSLITCLILSWFGSSVVRGFAITLAIGIIVSMFSAISVSRTFLKLFSGKFFSCHLWLFGYSKPKKVLSK